MMPEIYVDADACPVKDEVLRVVARHNLKVHFVSNSWMRLPQSPLINVVVVSQGADEADNWIADHIQDNDICISADIPLADRCIKKNAVCLSPTGKTFTEDNMSMALATRDLMTDLRDSGEIEGTRNRPFSKSDRSNFLNALEAAVQAAKRR